MHPYALNSTQINSQICKHASFYSPAQINIIINSRIVRQPVFYSCQNKSTFTLYISDDISLLHNLPDNLQILNCSFCGLTNLSKLPSMLEELNCRGNALTQLPEVPKNLKVLKCSNNK